MTDLAELFEQFSMITHLPLELYGTTKSVFPLIQAACSRHHKELPPDVPLWNSSIPVICLLGRPKRSEYNNIQGAVTLVVLNTLHLITHDLSAHPPNTLPASDKEDVIVLLHAISDVMTCYKEQLDSKGSHIVSLLEEMNYLAQYLHAPSGTIEEFDKMLKKLIRNTKKCTEYMRSLFENMFLNTQFEVLVPLTMQYFLDIQTYGIFESMACRLNDFHFSELAPIETARLLLSGDHDQASTLFEQQSNAFKAETEKRMGNGPCSTFCSAATKAASVSALEIVKQIKVTEFIMHFQIFSSPQVAGVPFQFAQTINSIIDLLSNNNCGHEIVQQLAASLITHTQDPMLQYICSAASYSPESSLGYISLMGAYLPVDNQYRVQHYDPCLKTVATAFARLVTQTKDLIKKSGYEIHQQLKPLYDQLPETETLYDGQKNLVTLITIITCMYDAGIQDPQLSINVGNLNRLFLSWYMLTALLLQTVVSSFVPNAMMVIEKNISFTQQQVDEVYEAFKVVSRFDLYNSTPIDYENFIQNVSKCQLAILPLVESMIDESPISLLANEKDFLGLLEYANFALRLFSELEATLNQFVTINPLITRTEVVSLITPIHTQCENVALTVEAQPETAPSLVQEAKLQMLPFLLNMTYVKGVNEVSTISQKYHEFIQEIEAPKVASSTRNIQRELVDLNKSATTIKVDVKSLYKFNLHDPNDINNLIELIQDPILKAATYDLFAIFAEETETDLFTYVDKIKPQLLELICCRINGPDPYEVNRLAEMTDGQLLDKSIQIAAQFPLIAGAYVNHIQRLSIPFIEHKNKEIIQAANNEIVGLLTITVPLMQICNNLATSLMTDRNDVNPDILGVLQQLGLPEFPLSQEQDPRVKSVLDLSTLYSIAAHININGDYLERLAYRILKSKNPDLINKTVHIIIRLVICAAMKNACYKDDILRDIKILLDKNIYYYTTQAISLKRSVYGYSLMLPAGFEPTDQINTIWAAAVAFAIKEDATIGDELERMFYLINPIEKTLAEFLTNVPTYEQIEQELMTRKAAAEAQIQHSIQEELVKQRDEIIAKRQAEILAKKAEAARKREQEREKKRRQREEEARRKAEEKERKKEAARKRRLELQERRRKEEEARRLEEERRRKEEEELALATQEQLRKQREEEEKKRREEEKRRKKEEKKLRKAKIEKKKAEKAKKKEERHKLVEQKRKEIEERREAHRILIEKKIIERANRPKAEPIINIKKVVVKKKMKKPQPVNIPKIMPMAVPEVKKETKIRCVRFIESGREIERMLKTLNKYVSEQNSEANKHYQDTKNKFNNLINLLRETKEQGYKNIVKDLVEIVKQVDSSYDQYRNKGSAPADTFNPPISNVHSFINNIINITLAERGISNSAQAELILMTSRVDALQEQANYVIKRDDDSLKRLVLSEAKILLRMTRDLGNDARAQTEYLARANQSVANERGLINAALQTSDSAQMFFSLINLFNTDNKDMKYRVIAASRGMRAALINIIVNLRAKEGSPEITQRIETQSEKIFERLNEILQFAEDYDDPDEEDISAHNKSGVSLIVQRRNAEQLVFKRRRLLEEAEEEIKRLNRANSKPRVRRFSK